MVALYRTERVEETQSELTPTSSVHPSDVSSSDMITQLLTARDFESVQEGRRDTISMPHCGRLLILYLP